MTKQKMMTLMNSADRSNLERAFAQVSGLKRSQFAVNSWGFPFIPIPQHREITQDLHREAPTNVNKAFLSHPIYHIDYELTKFDPDVEPEEQWCIRMYFIILSFDMWDSSDGSVKWVDVLESNGVELDDVTFKAYTQTTGGEFSQSRCKLDNLKQYGLPLKENNMMLPWPKVEKQYYATLFECDRRIKESMNKFFSQQAIALNNAMIVFGDKADMMEPELRADSVGGWWDINVYDRFIELNDEYIKAYSNRWSKAGVHSRTVELVDEIVEQMLIMNQSIALLNIPIIRTATTRTQAFSEMVSYLRLSAMKTVDRSSQYNYDDLIEEAMNKEEIYSEDDIIPDLGELMRKTYSDYNSCWKRMRLTVANFQRLQNSEPPFVNYSELFSYLSIVNGVKKTVGFSVGDDEDDLFSDGIIEDYSLDEDAGISDGEIAILDDEEDNEILSIDDLGLGDIDSIDDLGDIDDFDFNFDRKV